MAAIKPLAAFLEDLCSVPETEFTEKRIMPLLDGVRVEPDDLQPYLCWKEDGYSRNLLYKNDLFEVILLCWDIGQASPIHNHAGQEGWVLVQDGTLEVVNYRLVTCEVTEKTGGPQPTPCKSGCRSVLEETDRMQVPAGTAVAEVGSEVHIHQILNPEEQGRRAISIHIYSRPLDSCIVYDLAGESCRRVGLAYDSQPETASAH